MMILFSTFLIACSTSTHVITGTPRAPIEPDQVQLYTQPPQRFEEVAILTASSEGSWALTNQQKMNEVIKDLKIEAAKLGANGILLNGLGDQKGDTVAINTGQATTNTYGGATNAYGTGTTIYSTPTHKTGQAVAIYVSPDNG
jgi:hypothetical protein